MLSLTDALEIQNDSKFYIKITSQFQSQFLNNSRILISYFYVDSENYLPEGNNVCLRVKQKIISRAPSEGYNFLFNPKTTLFPEGDNFTIHI